MEKMDYLIFAIVFAGCFIGFSVLVIGMLKDYRQKVAIEAEADFKKRWLRMKEERASWRGLNEDMERDNIELRLENEALQRKIANMEALLAKTKLKDM